MRYFIYSIKDRILYSKNDETEEGYSLEEAKKQINYFLKQNPDDKLYLLKYMNSTYIKKTIITEQIQEEEFNESN